MTYKIVKDEACNDKWALINAETNELISCHDEMEEAFITMRNLNK